MGSLGARQLNAGSDLDLIVIYDAAGQDGSDGPKPLATRPYYARLTNVPRFLDAELAGLVNANQLLGAHRLVTRTGLLYQQSFLAAMEAAQGGMRVGLESGPIFMSKYEDVFHLPVEEARAALGIKGAVQIDTAQASLAWEEYA